MHVESDFACNSLVLVSSTPEGEHGIPRRMAEHLDTLSDGGENFGFQHLRISSTTQLEALFRDLRANVENGMRPILHLDMHASLNNGLSLEPSAETFGWPRLVSALRKINVAADGNLVVVLSACFGLHAIKPISIHEPTPFFVLLAPEREVSVSEIEDSFDPFYSELFETGSLERALSKLSDTFKYFHSERMFVVSFAKYVKRVCRGEGGRKRREQLLTEALQLPGIANTRFSRRRFRKEIKDHVRPDQALLDKYASIFLIGKKCSVTLADILREIDD